LEDSLTAKPQGRDTTTELTAAIKRFEESEHVTRPARVLSERDRDYKDGKQITDTERKALTDRKQPVVIYNRIQRKVNYLLGLERQTRKDPRAFPRTPNDEDAASAATDSIRFVCEKSRWDDKRSEAAENLVVEGTGIIRIGAKQTREGIDPEISRVAWDRFFADPHASAYDYRDASYMGEVIWQDMDDAIASFPDGEAAIVDTWARGKDTETYDDKPKDNLWTDYGRRRVRIVEMYYRVKGVWNFCIFTQAGFLVEPQPSPYMDEEGQPEHPYAVQSLYIDRDNNRYGDVRMMISPQDEINKRRSKALHLITMRQARIGRGYESSAATIRRELAKPDGIIAADAGEFEILGTNDMAAANLSMLQEAKAEIDLLGPNAALQGKNEQAMSGRALMAQQQGGMVEVAVFLDRIRCLSLETYRKVWNRIRQYWTEERWIRVTDDQRNLKFVGLNRPVKAVDVLAEQMGVTPENFAEFAQQNPQGAAQLQAFAQSPEGQAIARTDNAVNELDVDIIVDEGIDTPTVAAEQFDMLIKLAQMQPGTIPPDVLIEASSLKNKDALLERMRQPNPAAEMQQRGQAAQVAKVEADATLKQAQAAKTGAEAQAIPANVAMSALQAGQASVMA
jgi:hypothetical protein